MDDRAQRLLSLFEHPGWGDVLALARERIEEPRASLLVLMESNPDKLTGKTAIAKANRAKGVEDLLEEIESAAKFSPPTRKGGA